MATARSEPPEVAGPSPRSRIAHIRNHADPIRGATGSALTALGLLCGAGIAARPIARDICDLVRAALPADTIGIFWSTTDGEMSDAFVEEPHFLSADVVLSCQRYQQEAEGNWPSFTENVLAGPVAGYLLPYQTPAFYRSAHFAKTYSRIGAHHILDAVVHDGAVPRACLLLMRGPDAVPFDEAEIALAHTIAALCLPAFEAPTRSQLATRPYDAGTIVTDAGGRMLFHDRIAHQSLWMLAPGGGLVHEGPEPEVGELLERRFGERIAEARAGGAAEWCEPCRWGDFAIRAEVSAEAVVAVRFTQGRPADAYLARRLHALDIPPRRMMVAWFLAHGLSRKLVADFTELSVDTVAEHAELLFQQLGVRSTPQLVARLWA